MWLFLKNCVTEVENVMALANPKKKRVAVLFFASDLGFSDRELLTKVHSQIPCVFGFLVGRWRWERWTWCYARASSCHVSSGRDTCHVSIRQRVWRSCPMDSCAEWIFWTQVHTTRSNIAQCVVWNLNKEPGLDCGFRALKLERKLPMDCQIQQRGG